MGEIIILFVIAVLIMWSDIKSDPKEDPCEEGHKWGINFLNDRMECTQCGMKV